MSNVELRAELTMADMELSLELADGQCRLTVTDTLDNKHETFICTPVQAGAIWALAIAGDSGTDALVSELYKLAGPIIAGLKRNLRLIQ